ncbi:MAG TPA: hypothetical protein PLD59_03115 [Tepidisphaeraceae bacterium]|jgi:hypothetical protein|nr:hypothetical protein [Tepidisphaeraceae bacterium]
MAQELSVSISISGSKGGITFGPMGGTFTRDVSERDKDEGTTTLNTSAVDAEGTQIVMKSSLSTVGILNVKNLDTVNPCTIGTRLSGTYVPGHKIPPGEEWPVPIAYAANAIYGQGIGGAVAIVYEAVPA